MAQSPSLKLIAEIIEVFPEAYRDDFTSKVQQFYGEYLNIMTPQERQAIDAFIERKARNQERGIRAANSRRRNLNDFVDNDVGPTTQQQLDFYSNEEFSDAGIRRKFEGYNEDFIQARIAENNARRAELQQQLERSNRRRR